MNEKQILRGLIWRLTDMRCAFRNGRMLMRIIFSALMVACLTSCSNYREVFAPPSPAVGTKVNWPRAPFAEVRGYCYDYTAEKEESFFINGRMHQGVMDPRGVKLSADQTRRLMRAITVSQDKQERTPCYKPHHAFVFYDSAGKVVALLEMCFGCNKWVETPDGLPEYIDKDALWALCQELGLPTGVGNPFYTEACRRGRAASR
jgi:hypothetical protein